MNAVTAKSFYRFGIPRRRRSIGKAREVRIEPTPETLAKLRPPVWHDWPSELQLACFRIDLAVRFGRLPDSAWVAQRIGTVHTSLYAAPGYLAQRGVPATPVKAVVMAALL